MRALHRPEWVGLGLGAALIAFAATGAVLSRVWRPEFWLIPAAIGLVAFGYIVWRLCRRLVFRLVLLLVRVFRGQRPGVRDRVEHARSLREKGDYAGANLELNGALADAESRPGLDSLELVPLLNEIGMVGKYRGDFDRAEIAFHCATAILADRDGQEQVQATLLHNLAGLAHARGDARSAEKLARQGLAYRKWQGVPDPLAYSIDLAALAAILVDVGEFAEAHDLLTYVLAVFEQEFGPQHHQISIVLHNLGSLHYRMGDFATAATTLDRAAQIKAAALGDEHADLAVTLHNLGCAQSREGHLAEAFMSLSRAQRILELTVLPDHPVLTSCCRRLLEVEVRLAAELKLEFQRRISRYTEHGQ